MKPLPTCAKCGKEVKPKPLKPKVWTGHHPLCPRFGKKP